MSSPRAALRRLGVLASERIALFGSTAFLLTTAVALFLVYQSSRVMTARIADDFNEQQLILARQAASQIDARLGGIVSELTGIQRFTAVAEEAHLAFLVEDTLGRSRAEGMRAVAILDASGKVQRAWGEPADVAALAGLSSRCSSTPPGRLGPLESRTIRGRAAVEGALCLQIAKGTLAALVDVSQLVGGVTEGIRSGRTGYAWVIDDKGIFLAHADHDFVARNAFVARHERRPYISFSAIDIIMKDRMLRGEEGTGSYVSGWHRGVQGEIAKLIAYSAVHSGAVPVGAVWSVAVVAPTAEVGEAVHHIYVRQLLTQGAVVAALVVFAVTAWLYQRRLSQALRARVDRQQEYMSSLMQSSMDAIIFVDTDNRVQAWNKGAEHIFGYTADEMVGETFHKLVPPDLDADAELEHIQQEVNRRGYMRHYVGTRLTKDGRRITIELSRTLVRAPGGEPLGSVSIIRDITEKLEIEGRIYSTEKLASIGTLAAGVAHEINNPLAIILGFADLLLERLPPGSREHEDVKLIEHNANHARKIVQNILGFARVTEGLADTVDVRAAIDTVLTVSDSTLNTSKVTVQKELPEELPRVRGDPRELQQVVLNLVSNAVAAMRPEGGTLTIKAWQHDGTVSFSVADSGVGIPERVKPRIFDPFFTTKPSGEGTGLGLSLCYGIVTKYGGQMGFTSVARDESHGRPSGTTFTVTLPVAGADTIAEGAAA